MKKPLSGECHGGRNPGPEKPGGALLFSAGILVKSQTVGFVDGIFGLPKMPSLVLGQREDFMTRLGTLWSSGSVDKASCGPAPLGWDWKDGGERSWTKHLPLYRK